jgi:SAM-dependent methyltransferase
LTLLAWSRVGAAGRVCGIDAALEMIVVARRKAARAGVTVDFQAAVIERLPFPADNFDVVLSSLMMHHLPGDLKRQGLAEVARILKPGGRLLVLDLRHPTTHRQHLALAVLVGEEVLHRPRAEDIRRGDFILGQPGQERLDRRVSLLKATEEFGLGDEEPIVLHRAHPCCSNMRAYPLPPGSSDAPGRDRKTYTTTAGAIDHPCWPSQAGGWR